MKFTLSWLKDHLETEASLEEIVQKLTNIGLEVENVDDRKAFQPFTIAKILTAQPHENADKLLETAENALTKASVPEKNVITFVTDNPSVMCLLHKKFADKHPWILVS